MRATSIRLTTCAAILAVVIAPAAAPAALQAPFSAGPGERPTVAVDGAGTAYISWVLQTSGNSDVIKFCKVPRGARACTGTVTLTPDAEDILGRPTVFVSGSTVLIVSNRCCYTGPSHTLLYTSTDGGATFSGPLLFGSLSPSGDAIIGPDGALYVISDVTTGGLKFQRAPLAEPQTTAEPVIAPAYEYGGTLGFFGATPVAAFYDISGGTSHVGFTRWSGSGDVNDAATWAAPTAIEVGDQTRLAGGPSGLFLLYEQGEGGSLNRQYLVRKFNGTAFGAPLKVGPVEIGYMSWLTQDPAGAVHALWRRNGSPATLRYAASAGGNSWGSAVDLSSDTSIFNIRAAAAADHGGWAVWDQLSHSGVVRVAPLEYPTLTTAEKSVTVGSDVITLQTPKTCVSRSLVARLKVRSKKKKGHVVVKVKRVNFLIDGKQRVRDTRSPFQATIVLTGLKPGSTHQIRAKIFLKVRHGPQRSRSIRNTFKVCG